MNRLSMLATAIGLTLTVIAAVHGAEIVRTSAHQEPGSLDQGTDNCPGVTIPSVPYSDSGTTQGRIDHFSGSCTGATARDVVYQFTPSVTQSYRVSLCGSSYDTGLYIKTGGACPGTAEIACNEDFCGTQSELTAMLEAGIPYFIIVDGKGTAYGNYSLSLSVVQPGDNCANPRVINELPFCECQSSSGFTNDYAPPPDCPGFNQSSAPDVVYSFTPTDSITTSISLCGSSFNTILTVWRGCPNTEGSQLIACNDDDLNCGPSSVIREITFAAGVSYTIVVDGRGTESGEFALNVEGRGPGIGDAEPVGCTVACPAGATQEGENWIPNVIDNHNGGFFGNGSFLPIACGQTICGTSSYTASGERDIDAYRLTLPSFQKAVVCITTEFEAEIYISDFVSCA